MLEAENHDGSTCLQQINIIALYASAAISICFKVQVSLFSFVAMPPKKQRKLSLSQITPAETSSLGKAGQTSAQPHVYLSVTKWLDDCTKYLSSASKCEPLYQLQMIHDGRPSITYGFISSLRLFLSKHCESYSTVPEWEEKHQSKVVMTGAADNADPDDIGTKPWRVAIYTAATQIPEVCLFLDKFILWKLTTPECRALGALQVIVGPKAFHVCHCHT